MSFWEYLKIKSIIQVHNPSYKFRWRIERRVIEDSKHKYCIAIDDGNSAYHKIFFEKDEYDKEQIVFICDELAYMLNIESEVSF